MCRLVKMSATLTKNCDEDKSILKEQLSEEYYNAIMAVWEV